MTPGQAASYKAGRALYGPPDADAMKRTADERSREAEMLAYRVLGEIMQRVPLAVRMSTWGIQRSGIDVMVSGVELSGHALRGTLMLLAEQFDLDYAERDHSSVENMVVAFGYYQGAPVRFWRLVPPCTCTTCEAGR